MGEKRNISVDLIRVLAISLIIIFHTLYQLTFNNSLRPIGFVGISLFFIVSGFLLAKKYSNIEGFSIKWLAKRYVKIAILYYLALIVIIILFAKQTYSGSLIKNLLYHFTFLDPLSQKFAYGIISPAWFLTPLMGLYILYPYFNRFIKKYSFLLLAVFAIIVFIRFKNGSFTAFHPFFFMGEFCFGIAFFYNKKSFWLLSSLLTLLILPVMFIPYLIFYLIMAINIKLPFSKIITFIGANSLGLFLFHEAFIKVFTGNWHIYNLSKGYALTILTICTITPIYLSKKIQNVLFNHKKKEEKTKTFKSERSTNKKMKTTTCIIIGLILVSSILVYTLMGEKRNIYLSPTVEESKAILTVFDVSTEKIIQKDSCYALVKGSIKNSGKSDATNTKIICNPISFSTSINTEITKFEKDLVSISPNQETDFTSQEEIDCKEKVRFECKATCDNC